jgi:hypothetical protein
MTEYLMSNNLFGFTLCVCGLLVASGCGSSSKYKLAPVSGTVSLDGQPLSGAAVNFQPSASGDSANVGPGSNAITDDAGHFELNTIHDKVGAVVGSHRVRIYSYSPELPSSQDEDSGPNKERVPERYNYRTQLTFKVPVEGADQANFELTSP